MKVLAQLVHSVKWKPFLTASLWHQCYLISLVTRWFAKWFNPGSVPPKTSNHHFADAFLLIIFWRKEFQPLIMGHYALGAGRLRITKIGVTQCHTHIRSQWSICDPDMWVTWGGLVPSPAQWSIWLLILVHTRRAEIQTFQTGVGLAFGKRRFFGPFANCPVDTKTPGVLSLFKGKTNETCCYFH